MYIRENKIEINHDKTKIQTIIYISISKNWQQLVICFLCFSYFSSITSVCSLHSVCVSKRKKGILPIAEYEGSPRRFGSHYQQDLPLHQYQYTSTTNQQHFDRPPSSRKMLTSPTLFPRPGFPKVSATSFKCPSDGPEQKPPELELITFFLQRITTSPSNGSMNGTIADDPNKSSNGMGFEIQNNGLNRSPSMSPTQNTSSPIIPNKREIVPDSNSLPNSQAVPTSSQNSPASPLENESNVAAGENNAKSSPQYTGKNFSSLKKRIK